MSSMDEETGASVAKKLRHSDDESTGQSTVWSLNGKIISSLVAIFSIHYDMYSNPRKFIPRKLQIK